MSKTVTDPVCGMKIDPAEAAATSEHNGATHYFCAKSCKTTFDRNPASFVRKEEPRGCCHSSCCTA